VASSENQQARPVMTAAAVGKCINSAPRALLFVKWLDDTSTLARSMPLEEGRPSHRKGTSKIFKEFASTG
jgi:hypothetical protein